ncbi:toll-like receptor 4 [Strongylocentrotus purpuratus]|uniref:TIR domain-containing protein n=1 Tax=Strongylocentrotus purpuratus TaxID=7668 RepID=A0A7M7HHU6_STRPU|nr:toll-like receptor 4 [Strongylocentrotus purpuratus]|eukprot:XP_011669383.1 PREDICTED: uncharacterized protein LOC105440655 [Strongylocentrotus purpuratus]
MAITDVPRDFFDPFRGKRLSYLLLQQNEFKCYPSIFANLTSVYEMVLETFHIGVLEPAFFDGMKELRSLTASNTKLEQINPSGSSWKIDLRELDLSENNLQMLSPFAFKGFSVVIVVIVIVIVYHYRWQLRYKLFLLRLSILGYREILDEYDREDYDFDIYVISTEDDENWIQDKLKPYFQGLPYYKRSRNVFTEDDLPLGRHRMETIDRVLQKSFKILVLLSETACADGWFLDCFRMAMDEVADTQTEKIVVVFLQNIEEDVMPFYVRWYMGGQGPYVEWVEDDDEGQKYFWKRLEKCLSVNRKRNHLIPAE